MDALRHDYRLQAHNDLSPHLIVLVTSLYSTVLALLPSFEQSILPKCKTVTTLMVSPCQLHARFLKPSTTLHGLTVSPLNREGNWHSENIKNVNVCINKLAPPKMLTAFILSLCICTSASFPRTGKSREGRKTMSTETFGLVVCFAEGVRVQCLCRRETVPIWRRNDLECGSPGTRLAQL